MFPFRDHNPSGTVPFVTIALIAINGLAFLLEIAGGPARAQAIVWQYGLTPGRVTGRSRPQEPPADPRPLLEQLREVVETGRRPTRYAVPAALTFLTCMFLHGGWMHLIGNMWYLWIFGDNVEDRLGHAKFLLFYLVCGVGASALHIAIEPGSMLPLVGASGAIAGVLGAYMLAFPRARISTLVFLGIFITVLELPALIVLGFWFVIQFFSGLQSMAMVQTGGVAWWAHVGGFVLGMVLLALLQKPRERRRVYAYQPRRYR